MPKVLRLVGQAYVMLRHHTANKPTRKAEGLSQLCLGKEGNRYL